MCPIACKQAPICSLGALRLTKLHHIAQQRLLACSWLPVGNRHYEDEMRIRVAGRLIVRLSQDHDPKESLGADIDYPPMQCHPRFAAIAIHNGLCEQLADSHHKDGEFERCDEKSYAI